MFKVDLSSDRIKCVIPIIWWLHAMMVLTEIPNTTANTTVWMWSFLGTSAVRRKEVSFFYRQQGWDIVYFWRGRRWCNGTTKKGFGFNKKLCFLSHAFRSLLLGIWFFQTLSIQENLLYRCLLNLNHFMIFENLHSGINLSLRCQMTKNGIPVTQQRPQDVAFATELHGSWYLPFAYYWFEIVVQGGIDIKKAKELGIPEGPISTLQNGENVMFNNRHFLIPLGQDVLEEKHLGDTRPQMN